MKNNINSPDQRKHKQLLRIERKVRGKVGRKQCRHGVRLLEPHRQQPEHGRTANRRKEPAPVVSHRKVGRGDLNAEQNSSDRSREAGAYSDGAGRGQHLGVAGLILVDRLEWRDDFT